MEEQIGQQIGKYRILGELGRGTVGTVYRAYDAELGRDVALKAVSPHSSWDRGFIEHFLQQARATARLPHPNMVAVFDVAQIEGWSLVAMELLEGIPLDQLTRLRGGLLLEEVSAIVRQLASALDSIHEEGQVHGDVRSGNAFLSPPDRVVLTELGVVRTSWEGRIATSTATAATAPEQISGAELGPWTDLYALGVIAYELLIARAPFAADTVPALLHQIVSLPLPPLAPLRPDLPVAVERALQRALAKDPRGRFASGADLADALEEAQPPAAFLLEPRPAARVTTTFPLETLLLATPSPSAQTPLPTGAEQAPAEPSLPPAAALQEVGESAPLAPSAAEPLDEVPGAPAFAETAPPWEEPTVAAERPAAAIPEPAVPATAEVRSFEEALASIALPERFPWEDAAPPTELPAPVVPEAAAPAPPADESMEAALAAPETLDADFPWEELAAEARLPRERPIVPSEAPLPTEGFAASAEVPAAAGPPAPLAEPSPEGGVEPLVAPATAAAQQLQRLAGRASPAERLPRTQAVASPVAPTPAVERPAEEAPPPRRLPVWVWVALGLEVIVLAVGIVLLVLFLVGK